MTARLPGLVIAACLGAAAPAAQARELTDVAFGTNWVAEAEHGGFYQALADGTYADCGLDVTIVPGGPQVNNRALLLAGRIDFYMGGSLLALDAAARDIPSVVVAAVFQEDPQAILAHPGAAESWADLKDLTLLISDTGYASFYQWMIAAHGFTAAQRETYTFNPAPFIIDKDTAMQGLITSEPYTIRSRAGFAPAVFPLAEHGYSAYAETIETMRATIDERPEVVRCFVDASIKGWYAYLYGDPSAADALIKEANPEMSDARLAYARQTMKVEGLVDSGQALEDGIGALSAARVKDFYQAMVAAGVLDAGADWRASFTTRFVNKRVGMDLKTAD